MKIQNSNSSKPKRPDLAIIVEHNEFVDSKGKLKFCPQKMNDILSPKKKATEKENHNLYNMTSEELKKSVENDPFMRAKLKCFIKSTEKSLNKQNTVKSPKFTEKSNFVQTKNLQTMYSLEKQRKGQQTQKISEFLKVMKQNENKVTIQQKLGKYKESLIRY